MSLIIPANSITGGYTVDNSCRFNSGSSDYLNKTFASAVSRQICTYSAWIKISEIATEIALISASSDVNNYNAITIGRDSGVLRYYEVISASTVTDVKTTQLFRDPSAWYHIVVAIDSTQATSSNRIKIYVNGSQVTSFLLNTVFAQNTNTSFGSNCLHTIGRYADVSAGFFNGYHSEVYFINGQQLDPTSFGEFDEDSGIWKPIDVSGLTFGTNGFYLDFEDSAALGDDVSGNGNDFTVNNLTAIDQTTDTPTNNFATLNPLIIFGANNSEFKEGNLVYDDSRADWRAAVGTFGAQSGKWYWEMKLGSGTYHQVGIVGTTSPTSSANLIDLSQVHGGYSFYNDNGNLIARTDGADISGWDSASVNTTASTGDILMVALDMDNKFLYFGKNGTWVKSGDPTSGASGTGGINISSDFTTGIDALPGVSMYSGSDGSLNFGSPAFTISSGNTDGNGYGNFEYAVPSGYLSLCTANLSEVLG
jgi:hypothetical protein